MQNLTRKILLTVLLVIISVVIIVTMGLKGLWKKAGIPGLDTFFSDMLERNRVDNATGPFPETTLPSDIKKIVGTWSGNSDADGKEWQFIFKDNYAVRISNSTGYFHQGTAFIHWNLGLTDGNIRVPPGWSPLDVDITQSSEPSYSTKISLGAFAMRKDILKYCFSEPGKMVRPITDDSREGLKCFDLTKSVPGEDKQHVQQSPVQLTEKTLTTSAAPSQSSEPSSTSVSGIKVRVTDFHARILVQKNGTLLVHETIKINTDGGTFEQKTGPLISGIYRTIGGRIQGKHAYYQLMGIEIIEASLDGKPIPYVEKTLGRWFSKYVFIGPEKLILSPGVHEFTIDYKTDRHIQFMQDHDEFFWWIFGEGSHGWVTSIDTVAITVILPDGNHGIIANLDDHSWNKGIGKIPELLQHASESGNSNVLHYGMVLSEKKPYLSVVVSMPKGVVHGPDLDMRISFFLRDMKTYLPGLIGLTIFFVYYIIVWARVGRDPEKKALFPRYKPPADCSPAFARFLMTMGYDRTAFTSAILNLAAKGIIRILRHNSSYIVENRTDDLRRLSPEELVLHYAFFEGRRGETSASGRKELDAILIHRAYRKHRKYLKSAVGNQFFTRNTRYMVPGIIISIIVAAVNAEIVDIDGSYIKQLFALGLWTLFAGYITRFLSRKRAFELKKPSKAVYLLLLFPPALYSIAVVLSHSMDVFDIRQFMFLLPLFIMMTAHAVFFFLLRAPTIPGRKALDEIEGFKTYLSAVEGDKLDRMTPPEKTPAVFQSYLPYALALGVENRWSEGFTGEIDEAYTLPPLDLFLTSISRLLSR